MKVVCIDDSKGPLYKIGVYPNGHVVKGETYTVVKTEDTTGWFGTEGCTRGYVLAEKPLLCNDPQYEREGVWAASRFVPLEYYKSEFDLKEEIPDCIGAEV